MAFSIKNSPNSFVTFYEQASLLGKSNFITDTPCGIQKGFCFPFYNSADIRFQVEFISTSVLTSANFEFWRDDVLLTNVSTDVVVSGNYLGIPIYSVYVDYSNSDLGDGLDDGDCFGLKITITGMGFPTLLSNQCFKKITETCLTSQLIYINSSNAFGFVYNSTILRYNVIRLPLYFKEPRTPTVKGQYQTSQGNWITTNARLNKTYKGYIDEVKEEVHCALNIALNHDSVTFNTETNYSLACNFQGEYNQNFPNIMGNVDIWSADFIIFVTPFNNVNTNCG